MENNEAFGRVLKAAIATWRDGRIFPSLGESTLPRLSGLAVVALTVAALAFASPEARALTGQESVPVECGLGKANRPSLSESECAVVTTDSRRQWAPILANDVMLVRIDRTSVARSGADWTVTLLIDLRDAKRAREVYPGVRSLIQRHRVNCSRENQSVLTERQFSAPSGRGNQVTERARRVEGGGGLIVDPSIAALVTPTCNALAQLKELAR
jgi:hypothetical protein